MRFRRGESRERRRLKREARGLEAYLADLDHSYRFNDPAFVGEIVSRRRRQRITEARDDAARRLDEIDRLLA